MFYPFGVRFLRQDGSLVEVVVVETVDVVQVGSGFLGNMIGVRVVIEFVVGVVVFVAVVVLV